jgi:AraC family transcriptional regulator of adaptative response/methylated-DNA-[protein]-cysteine methyltransferase
MEQNMVTLAMSRSEAGRKILSDDARWQALTQRDRAADGAFWYSVRTTGVYCRPSCAARLPRRENVAFHASCADAEHAGFRPCRRCRPNEIAVHEQQAAAIQGGDGSVIRFAVGECSLGSILVAATAKGVCAIDFGDDPDALLRGLEDRFPKARLIGGDARFEQVVAKVVGLVETPAQGLDLPLDIRGTAFQQRVWQAIRAIPAGETASYTEIAARIGKPAAVRAVAQACGANAIAVAIPCHRVVRRDGTASGYRWGIARKDALLSRERERREGARAQREATS